MKGIDKNITIVEIYSPRKITIITIYMQAGKWQHILDKLEEVLEELDGNIIITGDFNAKSTEWYERITNSSGRKIMNLCNRFNMNIIDKNKPTHYNRRYRSTHHIDLTMVSSNISADFDWDTEEVRHGSDHYPIIITWNQEDQQERKHKWKYDQARWEGFNTDLLEEIPGNIKTNIDTYENEVTKRIMQAAHHNIPIDDSVYTKPPIPWWNTECKQAKQKAKRMEKRRQRRPWHLETIKEAEEADKEYTDTIEKAKNNSWIRFTESINEGTPTGVVWKRIRAVKGKYANQKISPFIENNNKFETKEEITNYFAKKWERQSSIINTSEDFKVRWERNKNKEIINDGGEEEDYNSSIELTEVREKLESCNPTAEGIDNITYQMLKKMDDEALKLIIDQFNTIWERGTIPKQWKTAILTPIPKPGKEYRESRPISLLPTRSRLMDKIINKRLVYTIEERGGFPKNQAAFRTGRGTYDNLITIETMIRKSIVEKKISTVLFLDIEKAYDTVYRRIILEELKRLDIKGRMFNYIKDFLTDRWACVRILNGKSDLFKMELGVPQGSSLSTTLFSLAMNTIYQAISEENVNIKMLLYVDDVALCTTSRSIQTNNERMNEALIKIKQWSNKTNLKIACQKSKFIHFHRLRNRRATTQTTQIKFGNAPMEEVEQFKYLGVVMDKKLTWEKHALYIEGKARRALNLLRTLSNWNYGADAVVLRRIYLATVRPIMEYAAPVIHTMAKSWLDKLQRIQNEAMRIITGAHRTTHIKFLETETNIIDMETRMEQLTIQYYTRTLSRRGHPVREILNEKIDEEKLRNKARTHGNFANRIEDLLSKYELPLERIRPTIDTRNPPWIVNQINTCNGMMRMNKEDGAIILRNSFIEHLSEHQGEHIYTDGSSDGNNISAAFMHKKSTEETILRKFWIEGPANAFIGECLAINKALEYVKREEIQRATIFTDSQAAIQALKKKGCFEDEIMESRNLIHDIIQTGGNVTICWSPGHVGIKGNEAADKAARETTEQDSKYQRGETASSIKEKLRQSIKEKRQQKWEEVTNDWYKNFKPKIGPMKLLHQERRKDTQLRRLKFGVTRRTHDYMMKPGEGKPECECFEDLTVKHWLTGCPASQSELGQAAIDETMFTDHELLAKVLECGSHLH